MTDKNGGDNLIYFDPERTASRKKETIEDQIKQLGLSVINLETRLSQMEVKLKEEEGKGDDEKVRTLRVRINRIRKGIAENNLKLLNLRKQFEKLNKPGEELSAISPEEKVVSMEKKAKDLRIRELETEIEDVKGIIKFELLAQRELESEISMGIRERNENDDIVRKESVKRLKELLKELEDELQKLKEEKE